MKKRKKSDPLSSVTESISLSYIESWSEGLLTHPLFICTDGSWHHIEMRERALETSFPKAEREFSRDPGCNPMIRADSRREG
jgi:hypothetical protein